MKQIVKYNWKVITVQLLSSLSIPGAYATISSGRDQFGQYIVNAMTQVFSNKISGGDCSTAPLYACNGLMVSSFEDDATHGDLIYWARSDNEINKLSMSYIINSSKFILYGTSGFVIWTKNDVDGYLKTVGSTNTFKPVYLCGHPFDGNTGGTFDVGDQTGDRADHGCGEIEGDPLTRKCQSMGISSVEQWWDIYGDRVGDVSCAFDLTQSDAKQAFDIKLGVRQKYQSESHTIDANMMWDENILQAWPEDKPTQVPVMAFFQLDHQSVSKFDAVMKTMKKTSLTQGRSEEHIRQVQEAYYKATNIFVPIVKITGWPDKVAFKYESGEQSTLIPETVNVFPE